jgi:hypothetical protein
MRERRPIRSLAVTVALVALLLAGVTLGSVWHHHAGSSDATCQICHLSHQPIDQPLEVHRAAAPAPMGSAPEAADEVLVSKLVCGRVPARAPPAA